MNMNLILPPEQLSEALAAWQRLPGPESRLKALQRPSKRRLMQLAAAGGLAAYLCAALSYISPTDSGLAAAALVSNPFCLTTASSRLKRPWTMPWLYGLATILQGIGIHKWDETITCRLLKHADVAEYYQAAGTKQFILHFRTPSLFLVSSSSPFTIMAVTERGSHVAFLQGLNPFRHAWSDHVCMEYFELYQSLSVTSLGGHAHMAGMQSAPDLRSMDRAELLIPARRVTPHASSPGNPDPPRTHKEGRVGER
eukprot:jgi/Astpho2/5843/Aster-x1322